MKNKRVLYIIIVLALIVTSVVVFFAVKSLTGNKENDENTGNQVSARINVLEEPVKAADIEFTDMEGNRYSLSDFEDKNIIINFWAVFCGPCVHELPDFDKAVKEFEALDTVLVAINIVEPKAEIQDFINDLNLADLDFYMDVDGNAANTYSISTIPRTLVINKEGYIIAATIGAITYDDLISVSNILN